MAGMPSLVCTCVAGTTAATTSPQAATNVLLSRLFGTLNYDRFLLEYDTERADGFEPLRFVPRGKKVVLGLISTKTPQLEAQADLLRRIDEAAKYVPLENLALSPQCGFASVLQGNMIEWDNQRRKLELLVDTARTVWARRPRTAHYTADLYSACQRGDIGVSVCMPLDAPSAIRRLGDE